MNIQSFVANVFNDVLTHSQTNFELYKFATNTLKETSFELGTSLEYSVFKRKGLSIIKR